MTAVVMLAILAIAILLVLAGAERINHQAEVWERYELRPPDSDDGCSVIEEADTNADNH